MDNSHEWYFQNLKSRQVTHFKTRGCYIGPLDNQGLKIFMHLGLLVQTCSECLEFAVHFQSQLILLIVCIFKISWLFTFKKVGWFFLISIIGWFCLLLIFSKAADFADCFIFKISWLFTFKKVCWFFSYFHSRLILFIVYISKVSSLFTF